ncbi:TPA: LysR family transcriptional regulator [Salmonella enterica subsp. houtenae serovar 47:z36:-]|nr:LysR family transcriptional regulator [Salmonella enterica]HCM1978242.1 LysR family transcriptional regulator [Salmonella enterica subsp. houtenae serovar 47:z36:-]
MNLFSSTKLKYFIAIMEEGSVSKACQKINISRTPLSRAISDLEFRLGFELFTRSKRGMMPNPYGLKLYNRVSPIYSELLKIENDIKNEINKNFLRVAVTSEIPCSIVSYIKNTIKKSNVNFDIYHIESIHDNHDSSQDYYDILITDNIINSDSYVVNDISFDIFMITSTNFQNNTSANLNIFHELSDSASLHFFEEHFQNR